MKYGFDNNKYLKMQSEHIRERIAMFGDKLYLEFGGKLFDDYHASRVLPGFEPDSKFKMLRQLKDHAEIVVVISASSIESNKIRQDSGLTYGEEVIRLIQTFRQNGFLSDSVVITQYAGQPSADQFRNRLNNLGIHSYLHYIIDGYPDNIDLIVSDEGYGRNDCPCLVVLLLPAQFLHILDDRLYPCLDFRALPSQVRNGRMCLPYGFQPGKVFLGRAVIR